MSTDHEFSDHFSILPHVLKLVEELDSGSDESNTLEQIFKKFEKCRQICAEAENLEIEEQEQLIQEYEEKLKLKKEQIQKFQDLDLFK